MLKPESILFAPLEIPRRLGQAIIWACDRAIPPNPELPRIGANIQVFEGGLETPPEPQTASGNQVDTLSEEAA